MLLALLGLIAAVSLPPKPEHYVTDRAGVLSAERVQALDQTLAEFERTTSDQILVYVDRRIPEGTTLQEMGAEAIRQWGVGQKGKDNGAILFLFIDDRAMRIEVGYGLEGALTDAKSKSILENVIKPELQRGDINAAVERGSAAIIATVRGEPYQGTGQTVAEKAPGSPWAAATPWVYFGLFVLVAVAQFITAKRLVRIAKLSRSERRLSLRFWLVAIAPVILVLVHLVSMPATFDLDTAGCYLLILIFAFVVGIFAGLFTPGPGEVGEMTFSHSGASSSSGSSSSHSYASSYASSSSSRASSSSSSSFRGGGGSGGGGGASGSW